MATTKTIQPTGETITIPAMADHPDMSVVATDLGNITDAVNAQNQALSNLDDSMGKTNIYVQVSQQYSTVAGAKAVFDALPTTFRGVCYALFSNGYYATCLVEKSNASYGSIIYIVDWDAPPFHFVIKNGETSLNQLAMKGDVAMQKSFTLAPGESITLTRTSDIVLPFAYIITSRASNSSAIGVAIGIGYGQADVRHKITSLINTSDSTFVADTNAYGLVVTNNSSSRAITYSITALDNG